MEQLNLTIFELLYLGNLTGKYMYAVPNVYGELSEHDASELRQAAMDSLLAKGFITMDFDGEITISAPVSAFVSFCTACDGYAFVSSSRHGAEQQDRIIWRKQDAFLCAALQDVNYQFTQLSPQSAAACINDLLRQDYPEAAVGNSVQLTQPVLKKAKRFLEQNAYDAAARLLAQNHVDAQLSPGLLAALSGRADLYSFLFVDMRETQAVSGSFLFAAGAFGCLQICPAMEGYRSAAVFTTASPAELGAAIRRETEKFIGKGNA